MIAWTELALVALALTSCGRSNLGRIPPEDAGPACELGLPNLPACAPPEALACLDFVASPTSSPAAEILAWRLDNTFMATRATFDRIRADLAALAADAVVAQILAIPLDACRRVEVSFNAATARAIEAGTYHAWDCLNGLYGTSAFFFEPWARATLRAHFNDEIVARQYAALPGVLGAWTGCWGFRNSLNRDLCVSRQGASLRYVAYLGSGDCPMGCIFHKYRYFVLDAAHTIIESRAWSSQSADPRPAWIDQSTGCITAETGPP